MHGGSVAVPSALGSVDALKHAIGELGATWTTMTPTHLKHLLAATSDDALLLPGLRILVGSAPLEPTARQAVMRRITPEIYAVYATNEVGALTLALPDEIRRNPATAGRPDPWRCRLLTIAGSPAYRGLSARCDSGTRTSRKATTARWRARRAASRTAGSTRATAA
ncbi:hypothetical protein STHU_13580 [Allostella humosa]|uniref:AMP-binding protein n=1 Tax=Stella humosa TaxID=94 RepID=UPI00113F29C4|nr:hypothetical protein STHU_13580 [Stella humosa]